MKYEDRDVVLYTTFDGSVYVERVSSIVPPVGGLVTVEDVVFFVSRISIDLYSNADLRNYTRATVHLEKVR